MEEKTWSLNCLYIKLCIFRSDIVKDGRKNLFLNCKHDDLKACLWYQVSLWEASSPDTEILAVTAKRLSPVGVLQVSQFGRCNVRMLLLEANRETHNKDSNQVSRSLTHIPEESVTVKVVVPALSYNSFQFAAHKSQRLLSLYHGHTPSGVRRREHWAYTSSQSSHLDVAFLCDNWKCVYSFILKMTVESEHFDTCREIAVFSHQKLIPNLFIYAPLWRFYPTTLKASSHPQAIW